MGSRTGIEWCHHTFNPWRGCTKVSAGCANCYAETLSRRNPAVLGKWGPKGTRVAAAESYWRLPLAWNRAAAEAGERRRVFCASLADVFEDRPELRLARARLFNLIASTPELDWLLLTKRPENIIALWPGTTVENPPMAEVDGHRVFANLWLGVSVEDQATADARIPVLLETPAARRFVSAEPLVGPVSLRILPGRRRVWCPGCGGERWIGLGPCGACSARPPHGLDWIIVGGESGPKARACDVQWIRSLVTEGRIARVPVFVKQRGALWYDERAGESIRGACVVAGAHLMEGTWRFVRQRSEAGKDPAEWPADLRVREFSR